MTSLHCCIKLQTPQTTISSLKSECLNNQEKETAINLSVYISGLELREWIEHSISTISVLLLVNIGPCLERLILDKAVTSCCIWGFVYPLPVLQPDGTFDNDYTQYDLEFSMYNASGLQYQSTIAGKETCLVWMEFVILNQQKIPPWSSCNAPRYFRYHGILFNNPIRATL